jgi:hypothetical protein
MSSLPPYCCPKFTHGQAWLGVTVGTTVGFIFLATTAWSPSPKQTVIKVRGIIHIINFVKGVFKPGSKAIQAKKDKAIALFEKVLEVSALAFFGFALCRGFPGSWLPC